MQKQKTFGNYKMHETIFITSSIYVWINCWEFIILPFSGGKYIDMKEEGDLDPFWMSACQEGIGIPSEASDRGG